jgi:hypothetical protein
MATVARAAGAAEQPVALPGSHDAELGRSNLDLSTLAESIHHVTRDAAELVSPRSPADLTWHPEAGGWSVAECLGHIAQTTFAFLPAIREAIASAPVLTVNRALRTGMLARLFVRNLEPPYRIRLTVLPQLTPRDKDFDSSWSSFVDAQLQLSEAVRSSTGLAIDRVKVKSPVYARLSYNVYGALRILAAHERRHLWQMRRILHSLDVQRAANSFTREN